MTRNSFMNLCEQHTASVYVWAHAHFGQNGNNVIKVFTCLFIAIKIDIRQFNVIRVTTIMNLIALVWTKYCIYMG